MDEERTVAFIVVILVITLLVFPKLIAVSNMANKFFAQAVTSKNSTVMSAGNNTKMTPMANATSEPQKQNNVTTAAGNNGHIYRGGAATGSGGE